MHGMVPTDNHVGGDHLFLTMSKLQDKLTVR